MSKNFSLQYDAWGRLVLVDSAGRSHADVRPVRCFPMSDPSRWISICNDQGHELVLIEDGAELPEEVRSLLEMDLARCEFSPVIEQIMSATSGVEPAEWQVRTDRGDTLLRIKSEDDVRRLGTGGALVIDAYRTRYLIPDIASLDGYSRRTIERYL